MGVLRRGAVKWGFWRSYRRAILPAVRRELAGWRSRAEAIPDPNLRRQALASIEHKAFHCEGGGTFALLCPERRSELVGLIVALQTLSDVLDSWTDRAGVWGGRDIRALHRAMVDAVCPHLPAADYRVGGRALEDGGYLRALAEQCRRTVAALPGREPVQASLRLLAERYGDLQVLKHRLDGPREAGLRAWHERHRREAEGLEWWEYAAACGSTLGLFVLLALAARPRTDPEALAAAQRAYVPWVCALHILLDYLIDQEEDRLGGDFNLASPYGPPAAALERLAWLTEEARLRVRPLPDGPLHELIVQGLPALYLADPKARELAKRYPAQVRRLLRAAGRSGRWLHAAFRRRRRDPVSLQAPPEPQAPVDERVFALQTEEAGGRSRGGGSA